MYICINKGHSKRNAPTQFVKSIFIVQWCHFYMILVHQLLIHTHFFCLVIVNFKCLKPPRNLGRYLCTEPVLSNIEKPLFRGSHKSFVILEMILCNLCMLNTVVFHCNNK